MMKFSVADLVKDYNNHLATGKPVTTIPSFRGTCRICKENNAQWGGSLICSPCRAAFWDGPKQQEGLSAQG